MPWTKEFTSSNGSRVILWFWDRGCTEFYEADITPLAERLDTFEENNPWLNVDDLSQAERHIFEHAAGGDLVEWSPEVKRMIHWGWLRVDGIWVNSTVEGEAAWQRWERQQDYEAQSRSEQAAEAAAERYYAGYDHLPTAEEEREEAYERFLESFNEE